ncbi:MAG: pitrilysin family protein [Bdellovibrio sp.]
MSFQKTYLDGVRGVTETHHHGRAVAIGFFVDQGSRHEKAGEYGLSHFLEHLAFKGTKKRTAFDIAKSLESLGGDLNAYTSKENTVFHALTLREHWPKALDVLSDLYINMEITKKDFEVERSVILQEMAMAEDQHEEILYDSYFEDCLGVQLGHPILGRAQDLEQMSLQRIRERYEEVYGRNRLIISAAGPVEHQEFVDRVAKLMQFQRQSPPRRGSRNPTHRARRRAMDKEIEQTHILLGFPCPSFKVPLRFEAFIANALIGGGMTSRLYQSIREKKGLAYTIGSHLQTFSDFGLISVQTASEARHVEAILDTLEAQLSKIDISERELHMMKTQVKGSLLLGADDVDNRMTSIAVNELIFEEYRSVESVVAEIDNVSLSSVRQFLKRLVRLDTMGLYVLGPGASRLQTRIEAWGSR